MRAAQRKHAGRNQRHVVAMHKERTSKYMSKSHALETHSQTPFASSGRCTATCHKGRQGHSVGKWETYDIKNRPSCQHVNHVKVHGLPNKDALHRLAMTPHTMAATTDTPRTCCSGKHYRWQAYGCFRCA